MRSHSLHKSSTFLRESCMSIYPNDRGCRDGHLRGQHRCKVRCTVV